MRRHGSDASGVMSGRRSRKVVLAARLSGLLGLRQQRLPFAGAAAPDVGAAAVVCERFTLSSLGCGWPSRAASWLECERWYVGMAVLEGGVGGLLGVAE